MSKLKTNSAAKKRFRPSKGGLKSRRAFRSHLAAHKAAKRMSRLRINKMIDASDVAKIRRLLRLK